MKATELRIGNYHESNSIDIPREGIRSIRINGKAFSSISGYGIYLAEQGKLKVKPIPLTEEWLIKFGFEKVNHIHDGIIFIDKVHKIRIQLDGRAEIRGGYIPNKIKHVHQLQNLYFALTGEELINKQKKDE